MVEMLAIASQAHATADACRETAPDWSARLYTIGAKAEAAWQSGRAALPAVPSTWDEVETMLNAIIGVSSDDHGHMPPLPMRAA